MVDKWVAECVPCKWQELYDTEDSAISAAESHVRRVHSSVPPEKRAAEKMGHVQQRTIVSATDGSTTAPASPQPGDGASDPPGGAQGEAGAGSPGTITIETPQGETITVKE